MCVSEEVSSDSELKMVERTFVTCRLMVGKELIEIGLC